MKGGARRELVQGVERILKRTVWSFQYLGPLLHPSDRFLVTSLGSTRTKRTKSDSRKYGNQDSAFVDNIPTDFQAFSVGSRTFIAP